MSNPLKNKLDTGISPQQFIDSMSKNQERFLEYYNSFKWEQEELEQYFQAWKDKHHVRCLILASDWCGDVVRNIPVVFRVMEAAEMTTEVLITEEHPDVMEQFLTMGGRAVPIVIFVTAEEGKVLGHWGPRPQHVQAVMTRFKLENPDREASDYQEKLKETYAEMGRQYGEGLGYQAVIASEIRDMLRNYE